MCLVEAIHGGAVFDCPLTSKVALLQASTSAGEPELTFTLMSYNTLADELVSSSTLASPSQHET